MILADIHSTTVEFGPKKQAFFIPEHFCESIIYDYSQFDQSSKQIIINILSYLDKLKLVYLIFRI